jgi:ADP-heptose:LPS heptosyltransferase
MATVNVPFEGSRDYMTLGLRMFAPGLGDLVLTIPPLFNLKARGIIHHIVLFVFNEGQAALAKSFDFIDTVQIVDFDSDCRAQMFPGHFYIDMAEHPLEKIWWGSPEYLEKHGKTPVKNIIEQILGGQGFPEVNPQPRRRGAYPYEGELSNAVLLAPGGRRRTKLLPDEHWLTLAEHIKHLGYDVYLIGDKHHKGSEQLLRLEAKGLKHYDKAWDFGRISGVQAIIEYIRQAKAVVSIDNGIYHIASLMEKPTLGFFGPMPSWLWGGVGSKTVNMDTGCGINCTSIPLDWDCVGHACMTTDFNPFLALRIFREDIEPWITDSSRSPLT